MPSFDSEYVYATWDIVRTDDQKASLLISEINGFSFVDIEQDSSAPQLILYKDVVSAEINSVVSTARAVCADVLNTYSTCYIRVMAPDGKPVKDINGVLLDGTVDARNACSFKCEQFGNYTVTYIMEDGLGNGRSTLYIIRVWDDEAPELKVSEISKNQKLNATVVFPEAIVTDNVTASNKCTKFITIKTPKGKMESVAKDGKYKFTIKGEYEITYCALDKNGNPTFYTYTVNVK